MMLAGSRNALWALLLAGAALAAGPCQAQTAPPPDQTPDSQQDPVKVTGERMPRAEAPRSSTCEELAKDPFFRAQLAAGGGDPVMGPRIYIPTRMPRNPDYSAPPAVRAGSALPSLPKSRFGMRYVMLNGQPSVAASNATGFAAEGTDSADPGLSGSFDDANFDSAIESCRGAYTRGGGGAGSGQGTGFIPASSALSETGAPHASPEFRAGAATARFAQARAWIASRDETLPMAFALFDQGRYAESLDWFRKAERKLAFQDGGDEAALFIGKLYLQGLGEKSDPVEGVRWLTKAATGPFNPVTETPVFDPRQPARNTAAGEAAVILGNLYRRGFRGVARDLEAARKWFGRANSLGHVPAAKTLGDFYFEGIGTPRDVKKAASYYEQAAKLDYAPAQVALADILYQGDGVPQDRKKALGWYHAAAKHNHGGALYALARAYDLGEGVKVDPQMAIGFYKSAALQGNAAAQVAMGTYFYEGKLVAKDDAMARRWFEIGAAGSDPDGMFNLAAMMARGEGGAKDLVGAWVWLRRASMLGHQTAPRAIAVLEPKMSAAEKQAAAAKLRTL